MYDIGRALEAVLDGCLSVVLDFMNLRSILQSMVLLFLEKCYIGTRFLVFTLVWNQN